MTELPRKSVPEIDSVYTIKRTGPWATKSGGKLEVLASFPIDQINKQYFEYDASEMQLLQNDIRGLRLYMVSDIPKNHIGGNEWHRIRCEVVFTVKGFFHCDCEDLYGHKKTFKIDQDSGLLIPPFILHSYTAEENESTLITMANTLFLPNSPQTHDTYSLETFSELQSQYLLRKPNI